MCKYPGVLKSGTHQDVEVWAIETGSELIRCAEKQKCVVESVKRREELYK